MTETVFAPGELAPRRHLYVVKWGVVLHGARVLTAGKMWGEDMILADQQYTLPYVARMMTYVGAITLSRTQLMRAIGSFPASARLLRRSACLLALRRHMTSAAREVKEKAEMERIKLLDANDPQRQRTCKDFLTCVSEASEID